MPKTYGEFIEKHVQKTGVRCGGEPHSTEISLFIGCNGNAQEDHPSWMKKAVLKTNLFL